MREVRKPRGSDALRVGYLLSLVGVPNPASLSSRRHKPPDTLHCNLGPSDQPRISWRPPRFHRADASRTRRRLRGERGRYASLDSPRTPEWPIAPREPQAEHFSWRVGEQKDGKRSIRAPVVALFLPVVDSSRPKTPIRGECFSAPLRPPSPLDEGRTAAIRQARAAGGGPAQHWPSLKLDACTETIASKRPRDGSS